MMILQLSTVSGHPVFRASSAFERGESDSKEHGKKSTQFDDNEENIEMLLRTVISINQLSISGALADWSKNWDKHSSEDSESSGTLNAKEILEMRRLYREFVKCPKMQDAHLAETEHDTDTSTTSTASTTKSAIRRRRKLRLLCQSQDWMAVSESHGETRLQHLHLHLQLRSGRLRNGKRVGAHGNLHHLRNGGDVGFLERIPENRRGV